MGEVEEEEAVVTAVGARVVAALVEVARAAAALVEVARVAAELEGVVMVAAGLVKVGGKLA